jgi:hypothetical protein
MTLQEMECSRNERPRDIRHIASKDEHRSSGKPSDEATETLSQISIPLRNNPARGRPWARSIRRDRQPSGPALVINKAADGAGQNNALEA